VTQIDELRQQVEQLRASREALLLSREVEQLRLQEEAARLSRQYESVVPTTFVDPLQYRRQFLGDGYEMGGLVMDDDRLEGRMAPIIRSEHDLRDLRAMARWVAVVNPWINGLLDDLANYVIGEGYLFTASTKRGASKPLLERVQDWIDEWVEVNDWENENDRDTFIRWRRDGQAFLRATPVDGGGMTVIRTIEPDYVTEPSSPGALEDWLAVNMPHVSDWSEPHCWSFGIATPKRDVQSVRGYFVLWEQRSSDWEFVPSSEMAYYRCNTDNTVKPGLTDLFCVAPLAEKALKLFRSILSGTRAQARIAYVQEHAPTETSGGVQTLVGRTRSEGQRIDRSYSDPTARDTDDAYVAHVPNGRKYVNGPMGGSNTPVHLQVHDAALRSLGVKWSAPEFLTSSNASNANFASTMVAQNPFVKAIKHAQGRFGKRTKSLLWGGLKSAWYAGFFRGVPGAPDDWHTFRRIIEIEANPPDVEAGDNQAKLNDTERRLKLMASGVVSPHTVASEEGYDFDEELGLGAKPTDPVQFPAGTTPASSGSSSRAIEKKQDQGSGNLESEIERHFATYAKLWEQYP
jgi:hypothetical protein